MEANEAMKAMARRIWASQCEGDTSGLIDGVFDEAAPLKLVLAAIMETQRLDSELAAAFIEQEGMTRNHAGVPVMAEVNQRLAVQFRAGEHYAIAGDRYG